MFRVGLGSDIHPFDPKRPLVLGGVQISEKNGLSGHSDADVLVHALCDALLGAAALGDLGEHFPSTEKNKDRSSLEILQEVCQMVWTKGFSVTNADLTILLEEPKISPYKMAMREKMAMVMNIETTQVGLKATTCEGLGFVGRGEGAFAQAVVLLKQRENR